MRYVSSILNPSGHPVSAFEYPLGDGFSHQITVSDTESQAELGIDTSAGFDCIGRGLNFADATGVVVCHTKKTATLQRYVNVAEIRRGVYPLDFKDADICVMEKHDFRLNSQTHAIISLLFGHDVILWFGQGGSVTSWSKLNGTEKVILPLYDLLIILCRRTGINLMSYETIQLGSRSMLWQSTVRLLHTEEANRFYTKMYLDVVGNYEPLANPPG